MKRWLPLSGLVGVGLILWWLIPARRDSPKQGPIATRQPSEEVARCIECHALQAESFLQTGHALTLRPADDPEVLSRFAGQTVAVGDPPIRFRFWQDGGKLWNANETSGLKAQVNWMFGSGHHGMTPVVVAKNERGEEIGPDLHVSWYRQHGLALTMGHEAVLAGDPNSLGAFNNVADTQRCFHCHTTELLRKGHGVETSHLLPGVLCSKCHTNAGQHAASMNAGQPEASFDDWKSLAPPESVKRCGECHRSPSALPSEGLQPNNRQITRFASVGLSLSQCFLNQQTRQRADGSVRRLDCLTCHDPHRPMPTDEHHYNRICRECHARPGTTESDCPQRSSTSDCVSCHMPKVRMNAPVAFTDHWIRVRQQDNSE